MLEVVEIEFLGGGKQRVLRIYIDRLRVSLTATARLYPISGWHPGRGRYYPWRELHARSQFPRSRAQADQAARLHRFSGQKAKIVTHEPVEDQKYWEGVLRGVEGEQILIEPSEGRLVHIPLSGVKRANLKFEW